MKHFITGGAGFTGRYLSKALLDRGETVRIYDINGPHDLGDNVEFVQGDIRDQANLLEAAQGSDVFYHLVGLMPQSNASEAVMYSINVEGTRKALEAATNAGVRRFIYLSSMEVYGNTDPAPFSETHPLRPISTYGRNKVEAENLCMKYWKERSLETVVLRPSTLIAPGVDQPTFLTSLRLLHNPPPVIPMPGSGKARFQMTAVEDCVHACILATEKDGIGGETFNMGADDTLPLREQVEELLSRTGKKARYISVPFPLAKLTLKIGYWLGLSKIVPAHIDIMEKDLVMDCSKAKEVLGWMPKKTNIDMILDTLEWYLDKNSSP